MARRNALRRSTPAVSMTLRATVSGMSPASVWASLPPGAPWACIPTASTTASGPVAPGPAVGRHPDGIDDRGGPAAVGRVAHGRRDVVDGADVDRPHAVG